jgi:hypothetical protein
MTLAAIAQPQLRRRPGCVASMRLILERLILGQTPAEPKRDRSERLRAPAGQFCLFCGNRVGGLRFEQGSEKSMVSGYRVIKVTALFDIYLNSPAVPQSRTAG